MINYMARRFVWHAVFYMKKNHRHLAVKLGTTHKIFLFLNYNI
jgi:hypothetical protein